MAGIRVFTTGIVNYKQVCQKYAELLVPGRELCLNTKVEKISETREAQVLETNKGTFETRFVINCAGLHSDRIAK